MKNYSKFLRQPALGNQKKLKVILFMASILNPMPGKVKLNLHNANAVSFQGDPVTTRRMTGESWLAQPIKSKAFESPNGLPWKTRLGLSRP